MMNFLNFSILLLVLVLCSFLSVQATTTDQTNSTDSGITMDPNATTTMASTTSSGDDENGAASVMIANIVLAACASLSLYFK